MRNRWKWGIAGGMAFMLALTGCSGGQTEESTDTEAAGERAEETEAGNSASEDNVLVV